VRAFQKDKLPEVATSFGMAMTAASPKMPITTFSQGTFITHQGERGDVAWLILEGEVEILIAEGNALKQVGLIQARQVVGEMALIDDGPRTATVVARSPVTASEIPRAAFQKLLAESEPLVRQILAHLINAIRSQRGLDTSLPDHFSGPALRSVKDGDRILERRVFAAGHTLFRQGEPADAGYLIQTGRVVLAKDGNRFASLTAGRLFGELALLTDTKRTCTAMVDEGGATVEIIRRRELNQAMASMPKVLKTLTQAYLTYVTDFDG
jgi:CRP-like cAMP-binding protein